MRHFLSFSLGLMVFSGLAFAGSWSGTLVDEPCFNRQNQQLKDEAKAADACEATAQSTAYALHAAGKIYHFDTASHAKVATALKSRADRTAKGGNLAKVMATISGTEAEGTIKVDSVQIQ